MGRNKLLSSLFGGEAKAFQKTSFTVQEMQTLARVMDLANADGATWLMRDGKGTDVIDMITISSTVSSLTINLYKMCEHQTLYIMDAMGMQAHTRDFPVLVLQLGGKLEDFTLIEQLISTEPAPLPKSASHPDLVRK